MAHKARAIAPSGTRLLDFSVIRAVTDPGTLYRTFVVALAGGGGPAIILTLTLTGRRRSEVINLRAGDLSSEGSTVFYVYRGKGGKQGRRELPQPACDAITTWLAGVSKDLATMEAGESLWPGPSGAGITSGTFYTNLRRYLEAAGLPASGVHIFRHSAAKLRRDAGESVEDVSRFLDHSSLAVTSVYLRRLEGEQDRGWAKVAEAIGV